MKRTRISKESTEDMIAAGRFNPSLELTFRDSRGLHTHKIAAGYHDGLHIYHEHGLTYVLTVNFYLEYVGLEVFDGDDAVGDVFLQGDQVKEVLPREDLAPFTMIRRLMPYIG
ncbi:MAG: hypothetical protein ABIL58_15240 [Pseudomonadota bacterium]